MSANLTLASRLDNPATEVLSRDLLAARGAEMQIDAGAVTYCGTLALQLLLSARMQWLADGKPFEIVNASQDLTEACSLLGFASEALGILENAGVVS